MYPIKVVEMKTGLTAHVIRAWEKRYSAVQPDRSGTNRRFYSDADIARLMLLKRLIAQGYHIGQIAYMETPGLERLVSGFVTAGSKTSSPSEGEVTGSESGNPEAVIREAITAVARMNSKDLHFILVNAGLVLAPIIMIEKVIAPLLVEIGKNWADGRFRVAHEHLATSIIREYLGGMHRFASTSALPPVIFATPAGHDHELGAMMVSRVAEIHGYPAVYLGSNVPAEDLAAVAHRLNAKVVVLSLIYPPTNPYTVEELKRLAQLLPKGTVILVGGSGSASYQAVLEGIGARRIVDFNEFRQTLESIYSGLTTA